MRRAAHDRGWKAGAPSVGAPVLADAADLLKALSHPARLRIVEVLSGGELCVKRLEEVLGVSQPSVSQHLARLKVAGLVESERRGHMVCYRLSEERAARVYRAALPGSRPRRAR